VKDERVYLGQIRDAIDDVEDYASVGRDVFMAERMRQDGRHSQARDHRRGRQVTLEHHEGASFADSVEADRRHARG
jgi:hypothetical protein